MIQKMPLVAKEALGQFHTTDRANRKQHFYLNYLETRLPGQINSYAKLPMEVPEIWYFYIGRYLENINHSFTFFEFIWNNLWTAENICGMFQDFVQSLFSVVFLCEILIYFLIIRHYSQCTLEFKHLDLIMHPVFRKLIDVKWRRFGKTRCLLQVALHVIFVIIWTIVGVTLPRDYQYYQPIKERWWNVVLESIVVLWTFYFIFLVSYRHKSSQ